MLQCDLAEGLAERLKISAHNHMSNSGKSPMVQAKEILRKTSSQWKIKKYSFKNYLNQLCQRLSAAFGSIAKFFVGAQNLIACTARAWRGALIKIFWMIPTKGQIISECFFVSSSSSRKRTKKFDFATMIPQVDLLSFDFWRKSKTPKNHFKII